MKKILVIFLFSLFITTVINAQQERFKLEQSQIGPIDFKIKYSKSIPIRYVGYYNGEYSYSNTEVATARKGEILHVMEYNPNNNTYIVSYGNNIGWVDAIWL